MGIILVSGILFVFGGSALILYVSGYWDNEMSDYIVRERQKLMAEAERFHASKTKVKKHFSFDCSSCGAPVSHGMECEYCGRSYSAPEKEIEKDYDVVRLHDTGMTFELFDDGSAIVVKKPSGPPNQTHPF